MNTRALAPLAALVLALPALATLPAVPGVNEPQWLLWNAETVSTGDVSWPIHLSLALRPGGGESILHMDRWPGQTDGFALWLAEREGLNWVDSPLEDNAAPGAISYDAAGNLHAAYRRDALKPPTYAVAPSLGYGVRVGGVWSFETVEERTSDGVFHAKIAVDAAGRPHILYDLNGGAIKYATKETNGSWTIETIGSGAYLWTDIRIDSQGRPHAVWSKTSGPVAFQYSVRTGPGTWVTEAVPGIVAYLSFDLDLDDRPHVAGQISGGGLAYYRNIAGSWTSDTVTLGSDLVPPRSKGSVGYDTSIAVDAQGRPHIAFRTTNTGGDSGFGAEQLHYAAKIDGAWRFETVDRIGFASGILSSLVLDDEGMPRVAYILAKRFTSRSCADPLNACSDLRYAEPLLATARAAMP